MYSHHNKHGTSGKGWFHLIWLWSTCSASHEPRLVWVYVALIFVAKIWSDLVLLSKRAEALRGKR